MGIMVVLALVALTVPVQAFYSDYCTISGVKVVGKQVKVSVQLKRAGKDQTMISTDDLDALMRYFKVKESRQLVGKGFSVAMIPTEDSNQYQVVLQGGPRAWRANLRDLINRGRARSR